MVSWHPNVQHPTRRKRDQKSPETQSHDQNSVLTKLAALFKIKWPKRIRNIWHTFSWNINNICLFPSSAPTFDHSHGESAAIWSPEAPDFQVSCATLGAPKFVSSALLCGVENVDKIKIKLGPMEKHTSTFAKKRARTARTLKAL